jgi:hypothetical protein
VRCVTYVCLCAYTLNTLHAQVEASGVHPTGRAMRVDTHEDVAHGTDDEVRPHSCHHASLCAL